MNLRGISFAWVRSWNRGNTVSMLTGALLDRLTHRVHILEAKGESRRLREAQMLLK